MNMNLEDNKDANVMIIPLSDDRLKKIARALSNKTAVTVLQKLVEKPMSATELSENLKIPLTTIEYSINALLEAELIKVDRVKFSRKRRDIKYYAPVKRALIFAPEKTEKGVLGLLKKALPFLIIVALSIPAGLTVQHIITLYGGPPYELPIDHAYIPLYVFIAGTIFAMMAFVVVDWFIKTVREKRGALSLSSSRKVVRRNISVNVATILFAIFGILAIVIGVVDIMNPIYPWGQKLPILGHMALIVGILSLVAKSLLWKMKRMGGYLGILSFTIAFLVNVYVGEHPLAHAIAGAIVGLILLLPLALTWRSLS